MILSILAQVSDLCIYVTLFMLLYVWHYLISCLISSKLAQAGGHTSVLLFIQKILYQSFYLLELQQKTIVPEQRIDDV